MSDTIHLIPQDTVAEVTVQVGTPARVGAFSVVVTLQPNDEEQTLDVELTMPYGSSVEGTQALLKYIASFIDNIEVGVAEPDSENEQQG